MKRLFYSLGIMFFSLVLVLSCVDEDFWKTIIPETDEETTQSQISGFIYKPAVVSATAERVQQLRVPEGFTIQKFAENLGKPRIIKSSGAGHVYVSDREAGIVMLLEDTDGDGTADRNETVANI